MVEIEAEFLVIKIKTEVAPEEYKQECINAILNVMSVHDFEGKPETQYYMTDLLRALVEVPENKV